MMEFWVRLTVADHGRDEDSGSTLMTAIEDVAPSTAPLIDQNLRDGRLSASLSVDGRDAQDAVAKARPILALAMERAGLQMTRLVGLEVSSADFAEPNAPAA